MKKILLILWLIAGISTLLSNDVSKLNYFLVWICLIMSYIENILEKR